MIKLILEFQLKTADVVSQKYCRPQVGFPVWSLCVLYLYMHRFSTFLLQSKNRHVTLIGNSIVCRCECDLRRLLESVCSLIWTE